MGTMILNQDSATFPTAVEYATIIIFLMFIIVLLKKFKQEKEIITKEDITINIVAVLFLTSIIYGIMKFFS